MAKNRTFQVYRGTTAQNDAYTGFAGELTMDTEEKELRVHDGSTLGGKVVSVGTGIMAPFAGTVAPVGWLVCDGSAISRTDYADLFAQIGSTYGDGDGSTTFNLPDCDGYLPVYDSGKTIGNSTNGGVPNITGQIVNIQQLSGNANGVFAVDSSYSRDTGTGHSGGGLMTVGINASRNSAVYDNGTTVRPAGVYTLWCIKY